MADWGLRTARVMRVYPESRTADVALLDTGGHLLRVPILGSSGGDVGAFDVPQPETSGTDSIDGPREIIGVLAPMRHEGYAIIGFLPPPRRQGMFSDGRMVYRHQSDTYFTIDRDGNAELYHPSGTFIRLGTPGHEDLSGGDVDGGWKIARNTGSAPTVTIGTAAGGSTKSTITIAPDGAVSIDTQGAVSVAAQGPASVSTQGQMTLSAAANMGLSAAGLTMALGGGGGTGTIQGTIQIQGGDIIVTGGDVIADGVSLKHHVHTGVQPGGGDTGPPKA